MTAAPAPLPLSALSLAQRPKALFFDIDDTFSAHGKIQPAAFSALWRAKDAGLVVVPVTGRPAGWCDHIARFWPVSGVVGENGAFAFWHDGHKLRRIDVLDVAARKHNQERLAGLGEQILREVAGTALASDQPYREYDLAIDFCEDVALLPMSEVERIVALFTSQGAVAKVSSIHVNGWFGAYDKLGMARRFANEVLNLSLDEAFSGCVFIGDSPNDQPMFKAFDISVGVANVAPFLGQLGDPPKFITQAEAGEGFVEVVDKILSAPVA